MSDDEMDTVAQQIWQHGTDPTNELRRRTFSFKNVWNRIRTGLYFERQIRTPPLDVLSPIDETWDRCDSAPPSLAIETTSLDIYSNETKQLTSFFDHPTTNGKSSNFVSSSSVLSNFAIETSASPSSTKIYINPSLSEGKTQCEICGKEFVKLGLLRLHMAAHMFEQSSRRYDYKCPFCNSCFRSKNLLQKHLLHAHPQQNLSQIGGSNSTSNASSSSSVAAILCVNSRTKSPSSTTSAFSQQTLVSPSSSNPRPFECNDCNIAFRIHGHLAKHLRSKSHIMKLECLEKVPIGTFAKLEESNCDYFADIDTSDSHNSLKSLIKLAERLMNGDAGATTSSCSSYSGAILIQQQNRETSTPSPQNDFSMKPTSTTPILHPPQSLSVSLVCTEELTPSPTPPPPTTVNATLNRKITENNKKSTFFESNGSSTSTKTVVADVWVPPKENANFIVDKHVNNFKEPPSIFNNNHATDVVVVSNFGDKQNETVADATLETPKFNLGEFKCKFCSALFPSLPEIDLHWHADHVFMRDGKNFKCPKLNCDTVYPSKRDLRNHLASHYNGTLDNDSGFGSSTNDVSRSTVVALSKKIATSVGYGTNNNSVSSPETVDSTKYGDKIKSNLVKLKFANKNSNDCSSTAASVDNSPISDSDASRASISSQSVSPVGGFESYVNRQNLKRPSFEDGSKLSTTPSKRLAMSADDVQNSRNAITPTVTPNSHHNPIPSPVAVSVPIVPQRPNVVPSVWNSFINVSPSSPQSAFLSAAAAGGLNPAVSLLGLQHPAFLAALQQNAKLFNGGWSPNFTNAAAVHPTIQLLATASPHILAGFQNGNGQQMPPTNFVQESVFSIEHLRCILCQKQCYTPMSLQEHLMSHNQPRLHVCKFCDAAFTTSQALQAHTPCRMQKVS